MDINHQFFHQFSDTPNYSKHSALTFTFCTATRVKVSLTEIKLQLCQHISGP